jgi:FlaA1/EpsC-like NDP-sugar epimerase
MFERDWDAVADEAEGRRFMVIGAAGSIGSEFCRLLCHHGADVTAVDMDENGLVELVRDANAGGGDVTPVVADAATIDVAGHSYVCNLAALKHVRSESDPRSLARMVEVNTLAAARLARVTPTGRLFSVSTDKAVEPVNALGMTKALMERLILPLGHSTARFPNVYGSRGSIIDNVDKRIAKGQPVVAPLGVRRYFISVADAARLCGIATLYPLAGVYVPRPGMIEAVDVAHAVRSRVNDIAPGHPVVESPTDTAGEKADEVFMWADDEVVVEQLRDVWVVASVKGDLNRKV